MSFFTRKILTIFLQPFLVIILLLILSILVKNPRYKKYFFYSGIIFLLFFSNVFIAHKVNEQWEATPVKIKDLKTYEVAVVLSGITDSRIVPHDRVYVQHGGDRIFHTIQLYRMGKIKKILITGSSGLLEGSKVTEAEEMKQVFLLSHVPDSVIILEDKARNTHENAVYTKQKLEEYSFSNNVLLVTSAFHMKRALATFKKAGINADPFAVDFISYKPQFDITSYLLPSNAALGIWNTLAHEVFGYLLYLVSGYI